MNEDFNAEDFLAGSIEGEFSTKYELVEAKEYTGAILTDVKNARKITPTNGNPPFASVDLIFELNDPEQSQRLGRKLEVRAQLNLDLDDSGKISAAKGKNVRLGKLLEANGLNGKPWNWGMMKGSGPYTVVVEHEPDRKDPTKGPYERISRFTKG